MDNFLDAFNALMNVERGFTDNPTDPGNWTGGRVGVGVCRGTKYGISAKSYPNIDIKNLSLDQARALAKRDYWDVYDCDQFDPRIGFQVFDAAYNGAHAALWLQQASGAQADGEIGPATVAAVKAADPMKIIMRFDAYRLEYMADIPGNTFDDGWMRRIAANLLRGAQ